MNRNKNKYDQAARMAVPNKPDGYGPVIQMQIPVGADLCDEGACPRSIAKQS